MPTMMMITSTFVTSPPSYSSSSSPSRPSPQLLAGEGELGHGQQRPRSRCTHKERKKKKPFRSLAVSFTLAESESPKSLDAAMLQPAVQVAPARQGRQQQAGFRQTVARIIRMAVLWYFAMKFFSPKKPSNPSHPISNLFQKGEPLVSLFSDPSPNLVKLHLACRA